MSALLEVLATMPPAHPPKTYSKDDVDFVDEYSPVDTCPNCQSTMVHTNSWKVCDIVHLHMQCMICGERWREQMDMSA